MTRKWQEMLRREKGFTILELIITMTILTVVSMSVIPLYRNEVKRQREQRLREILREMRMAIDEFHRDTVAMQCNGATASVVPQAPPPGGGGQQQPGNPPNAPNFYIDPRSRVMISDCTIFGVENPDRFPPDLETLVKGVSVTPRGMNAMVGGGPDGPDPLKNSFDPTENIDKKKVYLRAIPIDPMTGRAEWNLRSSYDPPDATSWGGENVFDVRSKSTAQALNGDKYSEW